MTHSDTLIRRSISQQKSGVSITIDDPVRTAKQPSPPRGKLSNIIHICNLVGLILHVLSPLEYDALVGVLSLTFCDVS